MSSPGRHPVGTQSASAVTAGIRPGDITGLVLAGGRGTRMGGADKGLQLHQGMPLALHALHRLQPQVGRTMLNANRNLAAYEAMGVPVWPDSVGTKLGMASTASTAGTAEDYPGPLAGLMAGLQHCDTPWLVTVPCDTPHFPEDLVVRLAAAAAEAAVPVALAATREGDELRAQPVFALVRADLLDSLVAYMDRGGRKVLPWLQQHGAVEVPFDDAQAFFNANTAAELQQLQRR